MFIVNLGVEYILCSAKFFQRSWMTVKFHNKELWKVKNTACNWCEYHTGGDPREDVIYNGDKKDTEELPGQDTLGSQQSQQDWGSAWRGRGSRTTVAAH